MKRSIFLTLIVVALILGLILFLPHSLFRVGLGTSTPLSTSVETTVPTPTEPQDIPVSYQNISFVIPVGLANGAEASSMPAGEGPLDPSPAFIELKLNGYQFADPNGVYQPRVRVYPAVDYSNVSGWAAESLNRLQSLLVDHTTLLTNDTLPDVPYMGSSAQLYAAQVKELSFRSGNGVRMISAYAQYPAPIGQHSSFYHYEGLTQDGKYYVVVEMPVTLPVYSDESNPGEFGITYTQQDWLYMQAYYQAVTELLNKADSAGFNPILDQVDRMVESITVEGTPAVVPSPNPCLMPAAGTSLLTNPDDGYCLLYPSRYSTEIPRFIVINPNAAPGDVPGDAWAFIQVEGAQGRTAEQAAEAQITAAGPGFNITRMSIMVDSEVAYIIDGLPGQDPNRQVFIVHNDRLYTITFAPWKLTLLVGGMGQRTSLEYLYNIVMQSFRFLP
jgi:hypothetical protein